LPQITNKFLAILSLPRGVRDRHKRGTGCGGRGCAFDERRVMRTAKSCGPDTPTLVSSCAGFIRAAMVARKPGHQGERDISRKTIAQGRPDCLRFTCMLVCAFPVHHAHETAGAARTRSSLRPLFRGGSKRNCRARTKVGRENAMPGGEGRLFGPSPLVGEGGSTPQGDGET